jgi:hypothetical protein
MQRNMLLTTSLVLTLQEHKLQTSHVEKVSQEAGLEVGQRMAQQQQHYTHVAVSQGQIQPFASIAAWRATVHITAAPWPSAQLSCRAPFCFWQTLHTSRHSRQPQPS